VVFKPGANDEVGQAEEASLVALWRGIVRLQGFKFDYDYDIRHINESHKSK
jgi:hypothetical protein